MVVRRKFGQLFTAYFLLCLLPLLFTPGCQRANQKRVPLPSIPSQQGIVGRTVVSLPAGRCVILQHPPTLTEVTIPEGADVTVMDRDKVQWLKQTADLLSSEDWSTFNCATFALCELFPFSAGDWLEPNPQPDNDYCSPVNVLLESYASLIFRKSGDELASFGKDEAIADEDIVCLERRGVSGTELLHLGRVRRQGGANMIISKLGTGALVQTTLETLIARYPCETIAVYRAKRISELRMREMNPRSRRAKPQAAERKRKKLS